MKTILITLAVTALVAITAIKEDAAEAVFTVFISGCLIGFATVCTWVTAKLRLNRFKRIREDNRLRREEMECRVVVRQSLAKKFEVVGN